MLRDKLKKILNYITNFNTSRLLLSLMHNGYLVETGWLKNLNSVAPLDIDGNPIPWTTYSFINFIKDHLKPEMELLEYGSGNSTLFYAERVKQVCAIEHEHKWFEILKDKVPSNTILLHRNLDEGYENSIRSFKKKFDVIIVDGRRREQCLLEAIHHIKANGLIVLDDSERSKYNKGATFLQENGFKKIDFWGISHRYFHNKATTIFFKHL